MTVVTPQMIKDLRERTGVGMTKCKEALEGAKGDMELAIDNLRKAGIAGAVKKEGRETKEGLIATAENSDVIALVEAAAETDFVVNNERFRQFLTNITEEAVHTKPGSLEQFMQQVYTKDKSGMTIEQYRTTLVQTLGENIQVRRVMLFKKGNDRSIGVYLHLGGKIGTAVEIQGSNNEAALAKELAMHVAASAPDYLNPKAVPNDVLDREKDIARVQMQGKPDNIINKILEGKMESFYNEVCLERQKYFKDDKLTVSEVVGKRAKDTGKPLAIAGFVRWKVGQ
jgi:elongation factor Ts